MEPITGTVVHWDDDEGWGALRSEALPSEAFAHFSELEGPGFLSLRPGQRVAFEAEHYPPGQDGYVYRAHRVRAVG